jgi:hypothetical protein
MGTFVRRLVALTSVWLLATAALTYAATRRPAAPAPASAATTTAPVSEQQIVVPSVVNQPYVFAEGTLGDAGFAWHVVGAVHGYAADTVTSQTPAAGTRVLNTGAPLIVLRLSHPAAAEQLGDPADSSPTPGTPVKLAGLAVGAAPAATAAPAAVTTKAPAVTKRVAAKKPVTRTATKKTPANRWPQHRPLAFAVAGARREPLDEMPLTNRAQLLLRFIEAHPKPTDANVRYWLYQHAWIVAGARMGWWHGSAALRTLERVDQQVWDAWGIGARSEQVARQALSYVEARS